MGMVMLGWWLDWLTIEDFPTLMILRILSAGQECS